MTTAEHASDATPDDAAQARLVELVLRARTFGIIAVLLLFVAITAAIESRFVDADNIQFILSQTSLYALIAVRSAVTNEGPATPLGGVMLWACLNAATLAAVCGPKFPSTEVGKPAIVR